MMLLYQLFFPLVAAGVLLRLAFAGRGKALKEGLCDIRERLGRPAPSPDAPGKRVWLHAASVGEVRAATAFIGALRAEDPGLRVLVTTSTVAGREQARSVVGEDCAMLAPIDFYPAVRSFLTRVKPYALILVETELWPMTLQAARARGVRLALINGRVTRRAFSRYRLIRGWLSPLLASFERAAVQSEADKERFAALGIPADSLSVCGNMKFDVPPPDDRALEEARAWVSTLGWRGSPIWAAGSTRPGEEQILLEAQTRLLRTFPSLKLILAPRHPEREKEVAELLLRRGLSFVRFSELAHRTLGARPPHCLLVDRLGHLGALYGAAKAAFVGGTLVPVGGHDVLEPARLGIPVLFGPHTESTQETAEALVASGGAALVRDAASLASALGSWLAQPDLAAKTGKAALATAEGFAGATRRTLEHLAPLLEHS